MSQDSNFQFQTLDCQAIGIDVPDLEETQIMDAEDDLRKVVIYLKTKNGRVDGAECTPFALPQRWTFATLKSCVKDYIKRTNNIIEVNIEQLYYKKAKGKAVVKLNDDRDIVALLKEYPLTYKSGKRQQESTMYLAVDYRAGKKTGLTPRKSPRLQTRTFDIFVYELSEDMKISSSADVLHKVKVDSGIEEIRTILKTYDCSQKVYTPAKGLFWIRKGSKLLVSLRNDQDFQTCKQEYKVSLEQDSQGNPEATIVSRKRKLDMSCGGTKEENELWNEIHVGIVRDLEKRGTLWRYGSKHLKLWTDEILNGNSGGVNEEPDWEKHLDAINIPPKVKKSSVNKAGETQLTSNSNTQFSPLVEMLMLQHQQRMEEESKRNEMFQTTMLMLVNHNLPRYQTPWQTPAPTQGHVGASKALNQMTTEDCAGVLNSIGLNHVNQFIKMQVDGPMLEALIHPHLGQQIMLSLGIEDERERHILVAEVHRLKANGYNKYHSTNTTAV